MDIKDERIDGGKAFDWGRTSGDYARFRADRIAKSEPQFAIKAASCGSTFSNLTNNLEFLSKIGYN